jgi:hypothetical protein
MASPLFATKERPGLSPAAWPHGLVGMKSHIWDHRMRVSKNEGMGFPTIAEYIT